jgi:hypothetical protein
MGKEGKDLTGNENNIDDVDSSIPSRELHLINSRNSD